jgi:hypothetical protein
MKMKKIVSILLVTGLLLGVGCKKGDVISDVKSLGTGAYVTLVKATNLRIDYANLSNTSVSITVKEYGNPIEKIKIYVTAGSATTDKTKWKAIKEVPYSGETVLTVKATEIATALGVLPTALSPGNSYTLYNEVTTKDGKIFDLTNTPGTFAGNSNYNMALSWTGVVVCPFVQTGFAGNFEVLEDGWEDYFPPDVITVSDAGTNKLSFNYGTGFNVKPIVIDIDPATGAATVPAVAYGSYSAAGTIYTCKTSGASNYVFSCIGTITLRLNHTGGGSNFGDFTIRLKKK